MTKDEALKLALEALEYSGNIWHMNCPKDKAITAIRESLAQPEQEPNNDGSPCPEFWDWLPKAYNFEGDGNFTKYNMEVAFLAGKQASQPEQEANHIGEANKMVEQPAKQQKPYGYVSLEDENKFQFDKPEIGRWQTVYTTPFKAQPEQEPVAWMHEWMDVAHLNMTSPEAYGDHWKHTPLYTTPPHRKPLSDEEIDAIYTGVRAVHHEIDSYVFARAIEVKHGIKEG